ncbi:PPR domain-containing protein/PPR_2 domain-containing protein [Cephalotus follicularis]|uniref:PPR domain-containing protein/PPR_2 domain-containing protein n=1 Tax=Cephalotus follicularis TaxID=3775 RepID=A0A1Q3BM18_CEPFO|nr:PPR domain-containing protein/PPR_2 domain-containing protein [Cephalotus follicularis]
MQALALSGQRSFVQAIHRTLFVTCLPRNQIPSSFYLFCAQTPGNVSQETLDSKQEKPSCLSMRIERLQRGEPVGSAFQGWMGQGFSVHRGDILHAINRLRKLKLNKRALEVMEWVIREKPYRPKELDYSYLLEFTTKLHGISRGEKLFKRKELERTWGIVQKLPHVRPKSYMLEIEAFGRIGHISRAEELWLEMKSIKELKSTEQFNSIIYVYCKYGFIDKASELFKEIEMNGCKPNAITYRHLALGCLKAGLEEEGLRTLVLGENMTTSKRIRNSTPWLETTLSIIEIFAEKGEVGNVEKLFAELNVAKYTRYTFVYNTLLKAYVKAEVYDPNFLRRIILGGARPDAETYSLLKLAELSQP